MNLNVCMRCIVKSISYRSRVHVRVFGELCCILLLTLHTLYGNMCQCSTQQAVSETVLET